VAKTLIELEYNWSDTLDKAPKGYPMTAEEKNFIRTEMSRNGLYQELDALRKQAWFKADIARWKKRTIGDIGDDTNFWPDSYKEVDRIWKSSRERAFTKMETIRAETGQKVVDLNKAKYNVNAGNYNLNKPLTAEEFTPYDKEGTQQVYQDLINFSKP
jgi:hypothetical protein